MPKGKPLIPDDLKKNWNKDYYELSGVERTALTEFYVAHLQRVQMGAVKKKLDAPFFMTQTEIVEKEETIKLDQARAMEKIRLDEQESKALEDARLKWESKRFLKLEEVEKLKLENIQLKLEMVERAIKDATEKKNELTKSQAEFAQKLESKHGVSLDDYAIDLLTGIMVRYPHAMYREPEKK